MLHRRSSLGVRLQGVAARDDFSERILRQRTDGEVGYVRGSDYLHSAESIGWQLSF
jgi:hypothetical protein